MIHTYTQIHIQTVFAVQNRMSLINKRWNGAFSYSKSQVPVVCHYIV